MKPNGRPFWPAGAIALLLLLCHGCASLEPSTAMVPPDNSGGFKVSEEVRTGIEYVGYPLYWAAMFFHTE